MSEITGPSPRPRTELDRRAIDAAIHLLAGGIWLERRVLNESMKLTSRIVAQKPVAQMVRTLRESAGAAEQSRSSI
jgi:hypothetical protein